MGRPAKSRTGCWTCRRRGYRCDEARPSCNNCRRLNITCEGYGIRIKFKEVRTDYPGPRPRTSRRNTVGTSGRNQSSQQSGDDEEGIDDEEGDEAFQTYSAHNDVSSFQLQPGALSGSGTTSAADYLHISRDLTFDRNVGSEIGHVLGKHLPNITFSEEQLFFIEYFMIFMAPCLHASKGNDEFSTIFIKLIKGSDDALLGSICSLAARHCTIANRTGDDEAATKFKVHALQQLRKLIQGGPMDLYTLATILMLATVEVFECNLDAWNSHIGGAVRGVLASSSSSSTPSTNYNAAIMECYTTDPRSMALVDTLCYHDLMSTLVSDKVPQLYPIYREMWKPLTNNSSSSGTIARPRSSTFYYMIQELFYYLSEIAVLATSNMSDSRPFEFNSESKSKEFHLKAADLKANLLAWSPPSFSQYNEQQLNASLFRTSAILYFYIRLEHRIDFSIISKLVTEGLSLLNRIPLENEVGVSHTWPLWQIGIFCQSEREREIILTRATTLMERLSKPSIATVISFLNELWESPYGDNFRESLTKVYENTPLILF
jgi:hypothetical protein